MPPADLAPLSISQRERTDARGWRDTRAEPTTRRIFTAKLVVAVAVLVAGIAFLLWRLSGPAPLTGFDATLSRVGDGDTIEVLHVKPPNEREKVRLLGIDAPGKTDPGYAQASAALAQLLEGKTIRIEFDVPDRPLRDKHDRLLAFVFVGGENVNVELVRAGWVKHSSKYGHSRLDAELAAAEAEAREARRGIWANP